MRRLALPALLAGLALAVGACSSPAQTPAAAPSSAEEPAGSPVTTATIVAKNVDWTPKVLTLAAGVPVHVSFQNADNGIPHNLHISGSGQDVVKSDIITGPAARNLDIGPLGPGAYGFVCDVHPNMTGTITVPAP